MLMINIYFIVSFQSGDFIVQIFAHVKFSTYFFTVCVCFVLVLELNIALLKNY